MHPLYGAEPVPYVPVRVIRGDLVAHRYTYASLRCRTSPFPMTFIPLSVSLWNDLADPAFDCVRLSGSHFSGLTSVNLGITQSVVVYPRHCPYISKPMISCIPLHVLSSRHNQKHIFYMTS